MRSNKSLVVTRPGTDDIVLIIAMVLDTTALDIEQQLSALVPEMARGGVRGGLLVVGDSTLVIRVEGGEASVDEVDTSSLLALADIDDHYDPEHAVEMMRRWIGALQDHWSDRVVGHLRDLLVPHVVAGLAGDLVETDGIWGSQAGRIADQISD